MFDLDCKRGRRQHNLERIPLGGAFMPYRGYSKGVSSYSVTLDEKHFRAVREKARAIGKTPKEYLQALIDTDGVDEILAPVRRKFAESGMSEDQLSDFLEEIKHRRRQERRNRELPASN
jgi:hypothetical protein